MARFLGIDWDHDRLYLVSVSSSRGKTRIEKALVWDQRHSVEEAAVEEFGERLRERLKAARIAPAPVVACLGRERVIFKEIRFPPVDEREEPSLVRFQAAKELTEPANRVVIDYIRTSTGDGKEDRRAIVSVARKPWLQALQTLCRSAGLKLEAVTPRPFGIAACLPYLSGVSGLSAPPPEKGATVAVVVLTHSWAEFAVVRDGDVLFARPLPTGEELLMDVRRNLALYASQRHITPGQMDTVQALYFAGDESHTIIHQRLQDMLAIPVHAFDPFSSEEHVQVSGDRSGYVGAVGLARQWAVQQKAPINFVQPKEPKIEKSSGRLHVLLTAALVIVLLAAGIVMGSMVVGNKEAEVVQARIRAMQLENRIKALEPEAKKVEQLEAWQKTALPLADELLDLTERFPQIKGFRVNDIDIKTLAQTKNNAKFTMRMNIKFVAPREKKSAVNDLIQTINQDKYCKAEVKQERAASGSGGDTLEFTVQVDLAGDPDRNKLVLDDKAGTQIVIEDLDKGFNNRNKGLRGGGFNGGFNGGDNGFNQGFDGGGGNEDPGGMRGGNRGFNRGGGNRGFGMRGGNRGFGMRGGNRGFGMRGGNRGFNRDGGNAPEFKKQSRSDNEE